jgi:archaetidylinositol phosphate synthase
MSTNTLIHRAVRPAVRLVARTPLAPNHLTTLRLATGLAAAAAFAVGGPLWLDVGALVFVLSMLLDRADGELARQTNRMSEAGHRYDLAADCIASIATFVGLGIGLAAEHGPLAIGLGLLAGLGIGVLFYELNVAKLASVRGYSLLGGRIAVDPDDAMIFVPILIWLGVAWPMTIVAAAVTPLAALAMGVLARKAA